MANLLADPSAWEENLFVTWNGSAFVVANDPSTFASFNLFLLATPAEGDVIAGAAVSNYGTVIATLDFNGFPIETAAIGESFSFKAVGVTSLAIGDNSDGFFVSSGYEYSGTVTPGITPPRILPIKQTFQAFRGFDTPATTFIRNEFGRVDLTGMTLSVAVYRYGVHASGIDGYGDSFAFNKRPYAEIEATSAQPELGIVQFTIPASLTNRRLDTGVYRVEIKAQNESLTLLAQGGILEVV